MSRWTAESDLDYYDEPWVPRPNATCAECGASFHAGQGDRLCAACLARVSSSPKRMAKATINPKTDSGAA